MYFIPDNILQHIECVAPVTFKPTAYDNEVNRWRKIAAAATRNYDALAPSVRAVILLDWEREKSKRLAERAAQQKAPNPTGTLSQRREYVIGKLLASRWKSINTRLFWATERKPA